MSEEEAIKVIKKYIELINKGYCDDCNELSCIDNFGSRAVVKAIETVLNMLERLKRDFDDICHECDRLEKIDVEKDLKIEKLTKQRERIDKEAQRYFEVIIQRDKIIDRMAEEIFLKRCYALAGTKKAEEEIEDWKDKIIKEYEEKVENEEKGN